MSDKGARGARGAAPCAQLQAAAGVAASGAGRAIKMSDERRATV